MKLRGTHIPTKLLQSRNKRISEELLLQSVHGIFEKETHREEIIRTALQDETYSNSNTFDLDKLESAKIFYIDDIEKMCVNYRLRFLGSSLFKANLPYEAILRIKQEEKIHNTHLNGFRILAPASAFKLKNADDPLLFAPIGNGYYYLIHSWGNDLHPLRKLLMWPLRHLENFMFFLLLLSLLLTLMVPSGMFSKENTTSQFVILFFFMFKWVTALAIFYGFKYGKNFSSAVWKSTYINA